MKLLMLPGDGIGPEITDVVATVLGTSFTEWVDEKIQVRNEEVTEKRDMNIELDADVAAAF